ncbi:MAG: hypothetical protein QOE66_3204 [Chloroflexota bacterium]|nr:hypothetical protein [Chloroflexota bacterium]
MRRDKTAISLALAGAALLGGSTALEANASAPAGGAIHLFSHPTTSGTSGTILIAGAIGDHGRYLASDRNGKPDPQGSYLKIILKKGTFEINATSLTDKPQAHDTATCSAIFSGTAATPVLNGTGLYTGIKGTLHTSELHALLASRYTSGKHKGQCKLGGNARPIAEYDSLSATGSVSFG